LPAFPAGPTLFSQPLGDRCWFSPPPGHPPEGQAPDTGAKFLPHIPRTSQVMPRTPGRACRDTPSIHPCTLGSCRPGGGLCVLLVSGALGTRVIGADTVTSAPGPPPRSTGAPSRLRTEKPTSRSQSLRVRPPSLSSHPRPPLGPHGDGLDYRQRRPGCRWEGTLKPSGGLCAAAYIGRMPRRRKRHAQAVHGYREACAVRFSGEAQAAPSLQALGREPALVPGEQKPGAVYGSVQTAPPCEPTLQTGTWR
jgi:hypothetical protein